MQSGKIKYWNEDKGYGFIDVDHQIEDVFFHVSNTKLSAPISVGQSVYFNSERNDKNQLRATEVSSICLELPKSAVLASKSASAATTQASLSTKHHNQLNLQNLRRNKSSNKNNYHANSNKKSSLSTLFSLVALIVATVYFFGDIQSSFFGDELSALNHTQSSSVLTDETAVKAITGDAQIDNTIALIKQGGPYPYPHKDGSTFYNREGRLPAQPSGYYREYTVPTPGLSDRGARRIVTGGNPPKVYYLTIDHYDSFSQLQVK